MNLIWTPDAETIIFAVAAISLSAFALSVYMSSFFATLFGAISLVLTTIPLAVAGVIVYDMHQLGPADPVDVPRLIMLVTIAVAAIYFGRVVFGPRLLDLRFRMEFRTQTFTASRLAKHYSRRFADARKRGEFPEFARQEYATSKAQDPDALQRVSLHDRPSGVSIHSQLDD